MAQARVQIGVYVKLMKVGANGDVVTTISGTFFAGGTASLWIFHFATSLYVRLGSTSNGAMEGEATYTFSFSVGFVHYGFAITATHKQNKMGGEKPTPKSAAGKRAEFENRFGEGSVRLVSDFGEQPRPCWHAPRKT